RLILHEGIWEGRRILSQAAVRQVTGDAGLVGHCGLGWWSNGGQRYTNLPADAVWGAGAGDQLLLVVPSLSLIMVRNGETLLPGPDEPAIRTNDVFTLYHDYRARILFQPLVEAVTNSSRNTRPEKARSGQLKNDPNSPAAATNPLPRSSFIQRVRWAPAATIR